MVGIYFDKMGSCIQFHIIDGVLIIICRHLDPTTFGDYPQIMKDLLGYRLPQFTAAQKAKLKDSTDFVGLNYYTSTFSNYNEKPDPSKPSWKQDSLVSWERKFFFVFRT